MFVVFFFWWTNLTCPFAFISALHAFDNLKAKLKAAFKKKGESKPEAAKPAEAADGKDNTTKPVEATAPAAAPSAGPAAAATTATATGGVTETKSDAPALAGKLYFRSSVYLFSPFHFHFIYPQVCRGLICSHLVEEATPATEAPKEATKLETPAKAEAPVASTEATEAEAAAAPGESPNQEISCFY